MSINLSLNPRFRLIHEPLRPGEHSWLALGEQRVATGLAQRLRYSDGGSFLVTGFRGVGKTTAVREALRLYGRETGEQVVAIELSLAQAPRREQLLFEMVRRLYETLDEQGVLKRLTRDVQDVVSMSYARTSLSMQETHSEGEERQRHLGVGGTMTIGHGAGAVRVPGPSVGFSRSRSRGRASQLSFLAYSDADAEHDLRRILASLRQQSAARRGRWYRFWSKVGIGRGTQPLKIRVVITLDEIDKLTERDGGLTVFEGLLSSLKDLLSSAGLHVVVVGGVDLHDAWVRDTAGPNSLYRSVFSWHAYTPCVWGQAPELLDKLGFPSNSDTDNQAGAIVSNYLEFTARGILRTLLFELNSLAIWVDDRPRLAIGDSDLGRTELLAQLQEWLTDLLNETEYSDLLTSPVDEDRVRLVMYYAVDWILRSGGVPFTAAQLASREAPAPIDPLLRPSTHLLEALLESLRENGFLESFDPRSPSATASGGPSDGEDVSKRYWLSRSVVTQLRLVARSGGRGRAQIHDTVAPEFEPSGLSKAAVEQIPAGLREALEQDYEFEALLGVGGMGTVWAARSPAGEQVAIKIMERRSSGDADDALTDIRHPGVVRTRQVVEYEGLVAQVMDLVDGQALASLTLPVAPDFLAGLLDRLLDALEYLDSRGWSRLDIKPQNIILSPTGDPVIIDLGTAVRECDAGTGPSRSFVGTPAFAAPEAWEGKADIRSELYSLAATMAFMLGGEDTVGPWSSDLMTAARFDTDSLPVSVELRAVLDRCLATDPSDRFPDAAAVQAAVRQTPEWRARPGEPPAAVDRIG